MGTWHINREALNVTPAVDDELIMEFVTFCVTQNPYEAIKENFPCTWFFTKDNRLTSYAGRFAEPSVWFRLLEEKFFGPRGYKVEKPEIVSDMDKRSFFEIRTERIEQFIDWKLRILEMAEKKLLQL